MGYLEFIEISCSLYLVCVVIEFVNFEFLRVWLVNVIGVGRCN